MARRGENIYKRKDKRWKGRYVKKYDENGKAQYASVYGHTYAEVKAKLTEAKARVVLQRSQEQNDKPELSCYAESWLHKVKAQVKQSTFVKYSNMTKNHLLPSLGRYKITEITTDVIKKFINEKFSCGNCQTHSGLSPKTVMDLISVLKQILNYASEQGEKYVCSFEQITINSKRKCSDTITSIEHTKLVSFLMDKTDNVKLGILICLCLGLRVGEICALKFGDVLLSDKVVYINKTMQRLQTLDENSERKTSVIITEPKSETSKRVIPLPDFLVNIIMSMPHSPQMYVLTGREDKYIEPRTMENKFKCCLKKCGLRSYNFHQLRHRFATYCIELGFDVKTLSEILGHSSVNITLNKYVHSSLDLKRANMNKLQENLAC